MYEFVAYECLSPNGFDMAVFGFCECYDLWGWLFEMICRRSSITVCMPLVFKVKTVMVGWVYVGGFRK